MGQAAPYPAARRAQAAARPGRWWRRTGGALAIMILVMTAYWWSDPLHDPVSSAAARRLAADPVQDIRVAGAEPTGSARMVADRWSNVAFARPLEAGAPLATVTQRSRVRGSSGPVLAELDRSIVALGWEPVERSCTRARSAAELVYRRERPDDGTQPTSSGPPGDLLVVSLSGSDGDRALAVEAQAWPAADFERVSRARPPNDLDLACLDLGPLPAGARWPPEETEQPAWCNPAWTAPAPSIGADATFHVVPGVGCDLEVVVPCTASSRSGGPSTPSSAPGDPSGCVEVRLAVVALAPSRADVTEVAFRDRQTAGDDAVATSVPDVGAGPSGLWVALAEGPLTAKASGDDEATLLAAGRDLRAALLGT